MATDILPTEPISLREIDGMEGVQFEIYLEWLFRNLGYKVEMTERFDFGADLLISRNGVKTAVQAKQRVHEIVKIDAVAKVHASMPYYECERSMVVTNGIFSWPARRLAKADKVELWDRLQLAGKMALAQRQLERGDSSSFNLARPATCANCGELVPERVRKYCVRSAHQFGGRILCRKHQRLPDLGRHRAAG